MNYDKEYWIKIFVCGLMLGITLGILGIDLNWVEHLLYSSAVYVFVVIQHNWIFFLNQINEWAKS